MRQVALPGEKPIQLEQLVLDLNGTLANRGELIRASPSGSSN
jgi:hypothetical protein